MGRDATTVVKSSSTRQSSLKQPKKKEETFPVSAQCLLDRLFCCNAVSSVYDGSADYPMPPSHKQESFYMEEENSLLASTVRTEDDDVTTRISAEKMVKNRSDQTHLVVGQRQQSPPRRIRRTVYLDASSPARLYKNESSFSSISSTGSVCSIPLAAPSEDAVYQIPSLSNLRTARSEGVRNSEIWKLQTEILMELDSFQPKEKFRC